jgi:hypothetical protein
VAALLLGYSESSLVEGAASVPAATLEPEEPTEAPSSLRPVVGDDWSFEDPSTDSPSSSRSWASNLQISVLGALLLFVALIAGLCVWVYSMKGSS